MLGMMANWNLAPLLRKLDQLESPLYFLVGERDKAVSPASQASVAKKLPRSRLVELPGLGHLAHEEDAPAVAAAVLAVLKPASA
jgi:magnesium chelatase accessory protein